MIYKIENEEVVWEEFLTTLNKGTHKVIANENEQNLIFDKEKALREQIAELKQQLESNDYLAIKHSEGLINAADYEPIRQKRQAIRDEINELENLLSL